MADTIEHGGLSIRRHGRRWRFKWDGVYKNGRDDLDGHREPIKDLALIRRTIFRRIVRAALLWLLTCQVRLFLHRSRPRVICVTGSVGKTSTKDMIVSVLSQRYRVRGSYRNYDWMSLALTILRLPLAQNSFGWLLNVVRGFRRAFRRESLDWLVLEIGVARPGDVARLTRGLRADIVVFTRLGEVPAHVGYFDSPRAVLEEKVSLLGALRSDGIVLLNSDDEHFGPMIEERARGCRVIRYGTRPPTDVLGTAAEVSYDDGRPVGMRFSVRSANSCAVAEVKGLVGDHFEYAVLAAAAAAVATGIPLEAVPGALSSLEWAAARMRILDGICESLILDDTYNASPVAAAEALATLQRLRAEGKKVAMLGDMLELGDFSVVEHVRLGRQAAEVVDLLVAVGRFAQEQADGARQAGMDERRIHLFPDARRAAESVACLVGPGDVVLVKGSQGSRMERIVEVLLARPEERTRVLARQEPHWQ